MKILNKLTHKHLLLNKKRTITTILGICLSTALMVGIGLLFATVRDNAIRAAIAEDGRYEIRYYDVNSDLIDEVSKNKEIKDYYYYTSLGLSKLENAINEYKPYIEVIKGDNNFIKELTLKSGRLPKNENEIVIAEHLIEDEDYKVKIGDVIDLQMNYKDQKEDHTIINFDGGIKTYTVVGIVERYSTESYSSLGYQAYTTGSFTNENTILMLTIKNKKQVYDVGTEIQNLVSTDKMEYHNTLLSLYGVSNYSNILTGLFSIMAVMLAIVSVGCVIVIYNSFAISVMERKKQFGLFASIGTTRKQLKYTVFYEALIVGTIGIILGIIGAYIGIGIVLLIINNLLEGVFVYPLHLATYPLFLIIPIIFMIITILVSALLPAKIASKVSPIQAIRQNDDIKMNIKKIKTGKLVRKTFGMEGEIALKNIKRNKKKYRITIISLFISVVMFISFSSLLKYGLESSVDYLNVSEFNIYALYDSKIQENNQVIKELETIRSHYQVDNSLIFESNESYDILELDKSYFNKKYLDNSDFSNNILLFGLSDHDYQELIKKYNFEDGTSILINKYNFVSYENNSRKMYEGEMFDKNINALTLCTDEYQKQCKTKLDKIETVTDVPFGIKSFITGRNVVVLTNSKIALDIYKIKDPNYKETLTSKTLLIQADKNNDLVKVLDKINGDEGLFTYTNFDEELRLMKNLILVIKILLYGFISLVTLIGVTSVFNTINTNMNLRRKEFAVLRSIGLTPKGFNKMLYFECIFFGLKALLYSLPVSIGLSYLIYNSLSNIVEQSYELPWNSIIFAIVGVFVIIFITMMYSSKKIKHENILEAIREENI